MCSLCCKWNEVLSKGFNVFEEICDLKDVALIDNSVLSFACHLNKCIPISPFYESKNDAKITWYI